MHPLFISAYEFFALKFSKAPPFHASSLVCRARDQYCVCNWCAFFVFVRQIFLWFFRKVYKIFSVVFSDRFSGQSEQVFRETSGLYSLQICPSPFHFSEFSEIFAEIPNFCPRKRKIILRKSLRINDRAFLNVYDGVNGLEKPSFWRKTVVLHPLAQGKNPWNRTKTGFFE